MAKKPPAVKPPAKKPPAKNEILRKHPLTQKEAQKLPDYSPHKDCGGFGAGINKGTDV